jgi:Tfp pilus assembly protein PilF
MMSGAPDSIDAQTLGQQALSLGRFVDAETCFRLAMAQQPQSTEIARSLAFALFQQGKLAETLALLEEVVKRAPGDLLARQLFGRLCLRLQEPAAAEKHFQRILKKIPGSEPALSGLIDVAIAHNDTQEAQRLAKRLLALNPRSEVGLQAAARLADMLADYALAQSYYDQLTKLAPFHPGHRYHRARSLLRRGHWQEGWQEYEHRFTTGIVPFPRLASPRWTGEPVEHLLLVSEQGLGDTVQFARFVREAATRARSITLACPAPLMHLLGRSLHVPAVDIATQAWPAHDVHAPLMSLPFIYGLSSPQQAAALPYLHPAAERLTMWAARFAALPNKFRVGIVHATSVAHSTEQVPHTRRSCILADLAPLFELSHVDFHSLQVGTGMRPEAGDLPRHWHHWATEIEDFDDTAALIAQLDHVIAVDTAAAHIAGALGKPVSLLLPFSADWRWMEEETRTTWYDSIRLFRQQAPGDWTAPVLQVKASLKELPAQA